MSNDSPSPRQANFADKSHFLYQRILSPFPRKIREREKTEEYRKQYQQRAGIEGTISQAVRGFGVRRSRYIGQAKTNLQQIVSATAINFVRVNNWLQEIPIAKTRQPLFAKIMWEQNWQN